MIRTETVNAGEMARAAEIGDRLARLIDARHYRACPVGLSFNGDGPPVTVGINLSLLSPLAKRFDPTTALSMGIAGDGSTIITTGKASYTLLPTAGLNDRGAMLHVVPFARLLELAEAKGRTGDLARKLAKEIGAEITEKAAKPSKVEALRAKEAEIVERVSSLEAELRRVERAALLDTAPLERAERLYTERVTALLSALRLMRPPWDRSAAAKRMDKANRETALGILERLSPALPERLMEQARAVFDIPAAHNIKRMTAAGNWFIAARDWVARSMGGQAFGLGFDPNMISIAGSFDRLDVGKFYPAIGGMMEGSSRRLAVLSSARTEASRAGEARARLATARNELTLVRAMLAEEESGAA